MMSSLDFVVPKRRLAGAQESGYNGNTWRVSARRSRRAAVAKGQMKSNKEARKPKKAKVKTIAANPSQKGGSRGLENLKND
jgi:hypothetical protein